MSKLCLLILINLTVVSLNGARPAAYWDQNNIDNLAVVTVPVADASGQSLSSIAKDKTLNSLYEFFTFSPEIGSYSCLRIHQLIFNEVVKINREVGEEVECEIFNYFYQEENNKTVRTAWLLKKNLKYLKEILSHNCLGAIPAPYTENIKLSTDNILTLWLPYCDSETNICYSAGTRFVRVKEQDNAKFYAIKIFDTKTLKTSIKFVPRKYAVVNYPKEYKAGKKLFLKILKNWVKNYKYIIPYVWGGCSFVMLYPDKNFSLISTDLLGQQISFWCRSGAIQAPYTGFDCTGLILRVAQICGMPYFCKNTATLAKNLKLLESNEALQEGDLIWYPGHTIIVSDLKKNLAIESEGYLQGYGKLHEIELSKLFENIGTYKDLIAAYRAKQKLNRLNVDGKVLPVKSNMELKIFKLSSVYK